MFIVYILKICLLNKYLLSTYYISDTILDMGNVSMTQSQRQREQTNKLVSKLYQGLNSDTDYGKNRG